MKIIIDGHEIILNEGDSIYFDSGYNHAMKALNNKPAKISCNSFITFKYRDK